jgi:hypothetical protein
METRTVRAYNARERVQVSLRTRIAKKPASCRRMTATEFRE